MKLSEIANGALQEHFEREAARVVDNLADINTDHKKKRKITLTLDLTTDEAREIIFAEASAKSTIVPLGATGFNLVQGIDKNGERVVKELKSGAAGQSYMDDNGEAKNDDGTDLEVPKNKKVQGLYK